MDPARPIAAAESRADAGGSVLELVLRRAAESPDAIAVRDAERELSYRQLLATAGLLAAQLRDDGLTPGGRVAVCVSRGAALPVCLLGIWLAGGVYLPVDPSAPAERIAGILADAEPHRVLRDADLRELPEPPGEDGWDGWDAPLPAASELAYVIHTSGSTGRPKGVEVSHGALHNVVAELARILEVGVGNSWLAMAPAGFDINMAELCVPLASGARLVLPATTQLRDPAELLELIRRHGVDRMQAVPSQWRVLLDAGLSAPGMVAMVGGEALPAALATRLRGALRSLVNGYGPTETTVVSTVWPVPAFVPEGGVRIGRPIAGTRLHLRDDHGAPVPPGGIGELWIAGDGVARGYLGRPELTAERFLPEPGQDGLPDRPAALMYRTGDLCRLDADGELEYLGRADDQLKLRGHRIEPGEVEACLAAHPGVSQVAVAVTTRLGGVETLTAFVVPSAVPAAVPPTAAELRAHAARRLPEAYLPEQLVLLEALPVTANGKTDRAALAAWTPGPDTAHDPLHEGGAPSDSLSAQVCALCAEALGLAEVRPQDDLFDLGAQSLTFMQLSAALRTRFGVVLPVHELYEAADAAEIVNAVRAAKEDR